MKKLLAVCSFSLLVAGCAHQDAGNGSAGGFAPFYGDCLMDSAYSLGPSYGYGAWDEGPCRNGGRRIYPYTSPESTNAIAQRASVVGHTRHRPDPRVITRPETGAASGGSSATSSVGQGSGSGFAAGSHAPSAPAAPAAAVPSPAFSSPPASQPAPH